MQADVDILDGRLSILTVTPAKATPALPQGDTIFAARSLGGLSSARPGEEVRRFWMAPLRAGGREAAGVRLDARCRMNARARMSIGKAARRARACLAVGQVFVESALATAERTSWILNGFLMKAMTPMLKLCAMAFSEPKAEITMQGMSG